MVTLPDFAPSTACLGTCFQLLVSPKLVIGSENSFVAYVAKFGVAAVGWLVSVSEGRERKYTV